MTRLKPLGDCQTDVSKEQGYSFSAPGLQKHPKQGQEHSPGQRLISRRTRGILPVTPELLQPEVAHPVTIRTGHGRTSIQSKTIMTEICVERYQKKFSLVSGYMPNPILSTSILTIVTLAVSWLLKVTRVTTAVSSLELNLSRQS